MKKHLAALFVTVGLALQGGTALAQPGSAAEVRDDIRDLVRFERLAGRFDQGINRQDANEVRSALQSFVRSARWEVVEMRREVEAARQQRGRGSRRNFMGELNRLRQAEALVVELEAVAAAEVNFGPRRRILVRARQTMSRFIALARAELADSIRDARH